MGKNRNKWGNKQDRFELSDNVNSYIKYRDQLMELGMTMIGWDFSKISKEKRQFLNQRQIEYHEYFKGATIFFEDKELGAYLCLPVILGGQFDFDDVPKKRIAYAKNGYRKELNDENSVVIYNNYLRRPSCYIVNYDANRLANIENAIDVNCNAQKTPVLLLCDENERLSMEQLYKQYEGNYPFIFGEKELNVKGVKALSTGAPFVADKMYQIKMQIWNEALTHLGISNVSYQKKERLVSDEVIRNMGGTFASRYSRLETRRDAVDKIKDMFGIDISVDFREDFRQTDDENMIANESENAEGQPKPMVTDLRTR
jgi:hypothetical protein